MLRRFVLLAVSILAGLNLPQIALGEEEGILLFGPQVFIRGKGKPVIESAKFFPLDPSAETTLNIFNGDANGDFRVSSAEVYLNGKLVVGPRNFNQKADFISVPVALIDGENIIEVQLRAKPGSFVTIDITAPDIVIGPEGGTATTTAGTKIEIPPDALTEDTVITIDTLTEETLPAPVPEGLEFLGGADFQPDGLTFDVPVTVTIPLNISLPSGSFLAIFTFDPDINEFVFTRKYGIIDEFGDTVSFQVDHFSIMSSFLKKEYEVTILGRVVTQTGTPVAGATVAISIRDIRGHTEGSYSATTNADGFFAVTHPTLSPAQLDKFTAKAEAPWGASGEAGADIDPRFDFKAFVTQLLGVPTDWPGLANFMLGLLGQATSFPILLTSNFAGWGGATEIEVLEPPYLHVSVEPAYVESVDGNGHHKTESFDITVEVWNYGVCDPSAPEGCVKKKEGTQNWLWDEGHWKKETVCESYTTEPTRDETWTGTVMVAVLSPRKGGRLFKEGWDSIITITAEDQGMKTISGMRYKSDSDMENSHLPVLIAGGATGLNPGNALLLINPIIISFDWWGNQERHLGRELACCRQDWLDSYACILAMWAAADWVDCGSNPSLEASSSFDLGCSPDAYASMTSVRRAKLHADLTSYSPDDYLVAMASVFATDPNFYFRPDLFFCWQGWIHHEWNFLKDLTSHLGEDWYDDKYINNVPPVPASVITPTGEAYGLGSLPPSRCRILLIPKAP